jgi:hypothetical protein
MSENAEVAARMQEEFRSKMDEELKALGDAFGQKTARAQSMATAKVLEYMRKTHPEAFFEAQQISLWDVMNLWDKLLWSLCFGIAGGEKEREKVAEKIFVRWVRQGRMPPFWAVPDPKDKTIVELRIGLDKKSVNTDRSNLCRE